MNRTGLGVGTTFPAANLHIMGSVAQGFESASTNITLSGNSIVLADTSRGNLELTLPYAANVTGRRYQIKKTSPLNMLYLKGGGNYIDNYNTLPIPPSSTSLLITPSLEVISDGQKWQIIGTSNEITPVSDNLVAWWPLDETDSNSTVVYDYSMYGNHGTLNNFNVAGNGIVSGNIEGARSFDGADDYISCGNSSSLSLKGPFTISFWFNAHSFKNWGRLLCKLTPDLKDGFQIFTPSTTQTLKFSCSSSSGTNASAVSDSTMATGRWYHVVGRYNRSNVEMYIDNVKQSTTGTKTDDVGLASGPLLIAVRVGLVNQSNVIMDDIRIYNKSLSETEISALYKLGH